MKIVRYIYLIISTILVFYLILYSIDRGVSYTYEVRQGIGDTFSRDAAGAYLLAHIETIRIFCGYVAINVIYLITEILLHRKRSSSK